MAADSASTILCLQPKTDASAVEITHSNSWLLEEVADATNGFFGLPLELRREIYHLALLAQAPEVLEWSTDDPNEINADPICAPRLDRHRERHIQLQTVYWGYDVSSNLYPVSQQWYAEIQEVLYSRFTFVLATKVIVDRPDHMSSALGFLPTRALQFLRRIRLALCLRWNHSDPRFEKIQLECQRLSANLPALSVVSFEWIHDYGPADLHGPSDRGVFYSSLHSKSIDMIMSCIRPFKHLAEINFLFLHNPFRNLDARGLTIEYITLQCAKTLQDEIMLDKGGNDKNLTQINVGLNYTPLIPLHTFLLSGLSL